MSYIKRIVVLANSYKPPNGRCLAGKELIPGGYGNWIRPVSARPTEEVSYAEYRYENHGSPKLLDVVDITLVKAVPVQHQTENHIIDANVRWAKHGELSWNDLQGMVDHPQSLWSNSDHTYSGLYDCISEAEAATIRHSLALIKTENFAILVGRNSFTGKRMYRAEFNYTGTNHNLSITDPTVRDAFAGRDEGRYPLGNVYLSVSLTQPFEHDGRCHKIVAAVISNPAL